MRPRLPRRLRRRPRKLGVLLTYDDVDMVGETLGHLLAQDHEVIVWDHGSTDGTLELLHERRRDLLELRSVSRDEVGLYDIYPAMSRHLLSGPAARYDWISWPDSDELLLGTDPDERYADFVDRVVASPHDWVQFRNWNFWWTAEDDPAIESPVERLRHYALFENCAPRIRAWRASATNVREFNHNDPEGVRFPELANLCHYPMRSREQAVQRLRTRADIRRGEQNWHYDRMQRDPAVAEIPASALRRADRDPRVPGLRLDPGGGFDWFEVYGR